jgi:aminoglycoside phosphotransferase (APT) family kinase protein
VQTDEAGRLSAYVGVVATEWDGSFGRDAVRLVPGRDHDVVVVGTEAVFRFPCHERAREALPREVAALAELARAEHGVGVVLPHVLLDRSDAPLGRAFVAQRYLTGEPLPRASVEAVGPMAYRFAAELARVLDALAATTVTDTLRAALTRAPLRPTFAELAAAATAKDPEARAAFDAVLALDAPRDLLVHGDFCGKNLRWDADDTRLTGVLDWGQVHLGDPAYDIASIADTYGWDLAGSVAEAAARVDDAALDRARAYAATFPFQQAL